MNKTLIITLVVLALLWWVYKFCGGDMRCPAAEHVMRSPLDWPFK
jgi:hypothetical protein